MVVTLEVIAGFGLLIIAGRFIVSGATTIAKFFGIAPFIIGATIVALGTSVPELATTVIAQLRGHTEVGLGTILGSNIFNSLFCHHRHCVQHYAHPRQLGGGRSSLSVWHCLGRLRVAAALGHYRQIARSSAAWSLCRLLGRDI